ncbi:ATP/GTP-binding protein [uncultured Rikenella sp.]|uniref:AAA family ATPase n=2 Tax=uncultured Rikenella sp. TaxID=368003 RepID=UPI002608C333|nr:ATP-binding protein [uncultured Rikenella sp.]
MIAMLLEFSCANFRSINGKCTISLLGQGISDASEANFTLLHKKLKVLKTAALYGANSSGKSNIIRAFASMIGHIMDSVKLNENDELDFDPFRLSSAQNKPTFFELLFTLNKKTYRYGFEYNSKSIQGEWLYSSSIGGKTEKVLFIRNEEGIGVELKNFPEGENKEEHTNTNRLFLSLCAQLGGELSKQIITEFTRMNVISGIQSGRYAGFSKIMLHKHLDGCDEAVAFFNKMKLGFDGIETVEKEIDSTSLPIEMPEELKEKLIEELKGKRSIDLYSRHKVYNTHGKVVDTVSFDIDEESEGTKKLIQLSGPIFNTLAEGKILWIDELDAKMHPLISQYIVALFNDPKTNPHNAQLIFSTHDTHLLSSKLLRRDQIWFTEKDEREQTDLYNMMDIVLPDGNKPRSDSNFERNYIAGRYGAIPYINE